MGRLATTKHPGQFFALRLGGEVALIEVVSIHLDTCLRKSVSLRIHAPRSIEVALGGDYLAEMTRDVVIEPPKRSQAKKRRQQRQRAKGRPKQ